MHERTISHMFSTHLACVFLYTTATTLKAMPLFVWTMSRCVGWPFAITFGPTMKQCMCIHSPSRSSPAIFAQRRRKQQTKEEIPSEDLEPKWHKHNIASCQTNLGLPLTKHNIKDSWNHILLIVSGRHAPLHVGMHAKRFACLLVCLFDCKRWPHPKVQAFPPSADNKGSQTLEQIDYNIIPLMPLPIT